jgi:hypothetical protein
MVLPDDVVLYNDLSTNHFCRPVDSNITGIPPPPKASKNADRVFVYDPYTRSMWVVGPTGLMYDGSGHELTIKAYRAYWAAVVYG